MEKTCVALFHESFEDLGSLAEVLEARRWSVQLLDACATPALGRWVGDPELLVLLGGPMGVYEADRLPFLRAEIELARVRLRRDRPTLGICLGSQIMAAALGARVYPGPVQEIGWYPIELECDAETDPVAARIAAEDSCVLHWHGDTFDLPDGAIPLARSQRTQRQGFRYGRNGYALQFHPEVLPERITEWTRFHAAQLASTPGAQSAAEIEAGAQRHGPAMVRQARAFLSAWLDRIEAS